MMDDVVNQQFKLELVHCNWSMVHVMLKTVLTDTLSDWGFTPSFKDRHVISLIKYTPENSKRKPI